MIKVQRCKCGGLIVENDRHFICNNYLQDIKKGIEQQQEIIDTISGDTDLGVNDE